MKQELERAKELKGKKLTKNEKFLVQQYWNNSNYELKLYSNGSIGYHLIDQS